MYVNSYQKFFTYLGYYSNVFAREAGRGIEKLTRPCGYSFAEITGRLQTAFVTILSTSLAALLFPIPIVCYFTASYVGNGRFEMIQTISSPPPLETKSLKVVSLNACFQDPWSPLTGGVVTPFESVGNYPTRIAGVVDTITKENPTLFLGQEFDNLGAQDEFIRLMQQKGFHYFVRDLGATEPLCNPSGLFVASKIPLNSLRFSPFPLEHRAGLAKWSSQGALTFTISIKGKLLRIINTHLNFGNEQEDQNARNLQLKNEVFPLADKNPLALFGDLNFDTSKVSHAESGLKGYANAFEKQITCTDEGKHILRGKRREPNGKPCSECEESIDGLIYDPEKIVVENPRLQKLKVSEGFLSDHFAMIASLKLKD